MNFSQPGSSAHGISQARILEWVATSFSGDVPGPGIEPAFSALAGRFFTTEPPGKHYHITESESVSHSVVSDPLSPWNSPGKDTEVDCHSLL